MRIVAVDYRTARWPIAPRGAARGRSERAALIVAVRDDTGVTGLGEAAPLPGLSIDQLDDAVRACDELAARVPFTLEVPAHATAIADRLTPAPAARFAIETALMAVLAQRTRTSIAGLLSALPQAELTSACVVDDEHDAALAVAAGAPCLKIKAPSPADLDRVHRIARAVPATPLRIDANRGWPREHVAALLDSLAGLPIDYVEEPCRDAHELLYGFRTLDGASALPVRIALDESLIDLAPDELARALESPHLAALILKPTLLGGFARCLELAAAAHGHGVAPVVSHALEGPIGTAACRELARAIGADVPVGLAPHPALGPFASARIVEPARRAQGPTASNVLPMRRSDPFDGLAADERTAVLTGNAFDGLAADERTAVITGDADAFDGLAADERTAVITGNAAWSFRECLARARTTGVMVATSTVETIGAIYGALASRTTLALLHPKAGRDELIRQRTLLDAARFEPDDAIVLFTSGSTGPSRGVVLSRSALLAAADASAHHLGWLHHDRWLLSLPLAHAGGLSIVIRCLAARKPIVLGELSAIERVTLASLVPAQLAQLLDDPDWRPSPKLRAVLLGGAACPPSLLDAARARDVPVLPTYGLTETFGQVATARAAGQRPVALRGVQLVTGTRDAPAPIRIRGPMLARRYLDGTPIAPELVTADVGYLVDGALHVLGRADDVIVTGGENVHPTQIEAVLAATPGVRAAAAFGLTDPRWGQIVAAAITVDPTFDRARAVGQWHAQLPPHARPRRLATLAELPRLPSGKIDRREVASLPTSPIDYAGSKREL